MHTLELDTRVSCNYTDARKLVENRAQVTHYFPLIWLARLVLTKDRCISVDQSSKSRHHFLYMTVYTDYIDLFVKSENATKTTVFRAYLVQLTA